MKGEQTMPIDCNWQNPADLITSLEEIHCSSWHMRFNMGEGH